MTMSGLYAASPRSNASSLATWFTTLVLPFRLMTKVSAAMLLTVQVVLLLTTLVSLCIILYKFTKGCKMSASMTLNVDLNSTNECPVYECTQTGMVEKSEMVLSSFSPDAQSRPAMLSRIRKQRKQGQACAQHKLPTNAEALTQGPCARNRGLGFVLHNFSGVQCSDRDSCNAETRCAATKLHTPQWFIPLTQTGKDPLDPQSSAKIESTEHRENTEEPGLNVAAVTKCYCLLDTQMLSKKGMKQGRDAGVRIVIWIQSTCKNV